MDQALFIGSEIYRGSSYGPKHPLSIPRVPTVIDLCTAMGWFAPGQYRRSPRAKPRALELFHTAEYVRALQRAETEGQVTEAVRERHRLGTLSNPVFTEMFRRPATAAGGSMLGADLLARGGVVYNPGGGTHHGYPDHASGFCYLNDPVLAIKVLLGQGLSWIAYVDIDAHHCDGVAAAFAGDERVLMISTHEAGRWPFTGGLEDEAGGSAVNLPLPRGTGDDGFAMVRDEVILPAVDTFHPQAIVFQCGADAVAEDPLSRLELSNNAHWALLTALMPMAPRLLVLGGGGYNPWTVGRLWAGVWATLNGQEIPDRLPPEAEAVLAGLTWSRRSRGPTPPHLLTTLRDPPRPGQISDVLRQSVGVAAARGRAWA
ncbi:acetoin utilization protein [Roseovarius sp. HI0049]|nr:acetoin utilization protein [Roseovarius sp. HI0049]